MSSIEDFSGYQPTWCPGCGDWAIGAAIKSALVQMNFSPDQVVVVFGIGCSGNMNDFLNAYAIHSLHGRAIPNALGVKIANHQLPVIAVVGDGDCYGEGGNHLIHAARGNHDITVIVHDNRVYGLTTGQVAPTAPRGYRSKSTPQGIIEDPFYPLTTALVNGATFIAQGFAGDTYYLIDLIKKAISHKGFSLLNVLQPCITFNKVNTYQYYRERVYKLDHNYDRTNFAVALDKTLEVKKEKFPLGVIYQIEKPTFTDQLSQLKEVPLIKKKSFSELSELIKDFV